MTQRLSSTGDGLGARVAFFALVSCVWLALLVAQPAGVAHADTDDDPAPLPVPGEPSDEKADLFQLLLDAEGDGQWRGVLNRIRKEQDGAWIGQILGQLFREPAAFADKTACAAYTAAYLADHPENGKVLLAGDIIRRAHRDDAFVKAVRSHVTAGEGGWDRLLDRARSMLEDPDVRARIPGIWFLSRESGAERERVLRDLHERARSDLPRLDAAEGPLSELARSYLEALETLLGYSFDSVEEAVTGLDELKELDLAAIIRELSRRKDSPGSPAQRKLIEYGKRLVDAKVAGGEAAALEEFLDPARTPRVQIRRYAMQMARQLGPQPDAVWSKLLRRVLLDEDDGETLRGALDVLEGTGFGSVLDVAKPLTAALARRLQERGPSGIRARDTLVDRVRMAKAIGGLKVRDGAIDEVLGATDALEPELLAELVRAMGGLAGVTAEDVIAHYRSHPGDDARSISVRVAVADALGRPGMRSGDGDAAGASAALREVLTGEGLAALGRATQPQVRQHAIRSLGSYPGEHTTRVLEAIALAPDEQEARVAIAVLRRAATVDAYAVKALADLSASADVSTELRIEGLQALAGLGEAAAEALRAAARQGARDVLADAQAPAEVRLEAGVTASRLLDPEALDLVHAFWKEEPGRPARLVVLFDLASGLGLADASSHARLAALLESMEKEADWSTVDDFSRSLTEKLPQPALQVARSKLLYGRATFDEDANPETAGPALAEADRLLGDVLGQEPADDELGALHLLVRVKRRMGEIAADDAARKVHYLASVDLAARSTQADVAALGKEVADRLEEAPLKDLLTEEETRRLAEATGAIDAVLEG